MIESNVSTGQGSEGRVQLAGTAALILSQRAAEAQKKFVIDVQKAVKEADKAEKADQRREPLPGQPRQDEVDDDLGVVDKVRLSGELKADAAQNDFGTSSPSTPSPASEQQALDLPGSAPAPSAAKTPSLDILI